MRRGGGDVLGEGKVGDGSLLGGRDLLTDLG